MLARIKQINPKYAAILLVGLGHKQIISVICSLIKYFKKVKQTEAYEEYVGIQINPMDYYVGVGIPHPDRNGNIIDFSLKREKKGTTSNDPEVTINEIAKYLGENQKYDFVGVSSFASLSNDVQKKMFKNREENKGANSMWDSYPVLEKIKKVVKSKKYGFQTQYKLGNHKISSSLVYIDIGTQISIGIISEGKLLHGWANLSGGHVLVQRHPSQQKDFKGTCQYHQNCLQGLITLQSICSRQNIDMLRLHTIRDDSSIWKLVGFYIAQLCYNLTLLISPQTIVISGDIMNRKQIFSSIQQSFITQLNQYISCKKLQKSSINTYITRPKIVSSGIKGSMLLKNISK